MNFVHFSVTIMYSIKEASELLRLFALFKCCKVKEFKFGY